MAVGSTSRLNVQLLSGALLFAGTLSAVDAAFTTNITSDHTLPTPTIVSRAANVYNINGGTVRGSNLFQSFQFFNVGTGDIASFNGPANIASILSRVTGGQSMIDGQLRSTITGANLYLMNPAGVIFGPNATLNVSGSFHVTTADYLRLTDNVRFTALPGTQDALLTTAPVAAFGFLGNSANAISITGSTLEVPEASGTGNIFSLIGGPINVAGATLRARHGQFNIASVGSPGEVILNLPSEVPNLDVTGFSTLGPIMVTGNGIDTFSLITVGSTLGSGSVLIRGDSLVLNAVVITAANLGTGNADAAPTGIDIQTAHDVLIKNGGIVQAQTLGSGQGANIRISTPSLTIMNDVSFIAQSNAAPQLLTDTQGTGKAGDITLNVQTLEMRDRGSINADTSGAGKGGVLQVNADKIVLSSAHSNGTVTGFVADTRGTGDAGALRVMANDLQMLDGAAIRTLVFGSGRGADIDVKTKSLVISGVDNTGFGSIIQAQLIRNTTRGQAGDIHITTDTLEISNRGGIATNSLFGTGNAGNIDISAGRLVITGLANSTNPLGAGQVSGGASDFTGISTSTKTGRGGSVHVKADDIVITDQGAIVSRSSGPGKGGSIAVDANSIELNNRAILNATSQNVGNAGSITITAADRLVSRNSTVTTQANTADGGNINIQAGNLLHLVNSTISTSVGTGSGNGGNITIDPQFVILQNGSRILANAFGGNGGNINITAGLLLVSPDSVINASSALGVSGTITINSAISDLSGSLTPLPQGFLASKAVLQSRCAAKYKDGKYSSFVLAGLEASPSEPGGLLPSPISGAAETGTARTAPGDAVLVALNLATESLNGGCRQ